MERNIEIEGTETIGNVFGSFDENIKLIEKELDVAVVNRDGQISVDDAQYILLYYVKNTLSHSPTDWYEIVK